LSLLKNQEISYTEFEILPKESKVQGGMGEINIAIWKQVRVILKTVNTRADPRLRYKNFVYEVSIVA